MSSNQILLLGAIAGFTIFLGLPAGRLTRLPIAAAAFLAAAATRDPPVLALGRALGRDRAGRGRAHCLLGRSHGQRVDVRRLRGAVHGLLRRRLMSLVYFDQIVSGRRPRIRSVGAASAVEYEGADAGGRHVRADALAADRDRYRAPQLLRRARDRPVCGERRDQPRPHADRRLRAPQRDRGVRDRRALRGRGERPTLARSSALLGAIGGGPTFLGTLVGQTWVNEALSIAFLALAAGSILYVIVELLGSAAASTARRSSPGASSPVCSSASPPTSFSSPPARS